MKLGTRLTLTTVSLVILALGVYGVAAVRIRSVELTADLERQTKSVGDALRVALEAALQEGLYEDVRRLVARIQGAETSLGITYLEQLGAQGARPPAVAAPPADADAEDSGYHPPPPDPARDARVRRILINGDPYGEHGVDRTGRPIYAYTVPLRDADHRIVAAIDLVRDASDAEQELADSTREVLATGIAVGAVLTLLVWLTTRSGISHPLQRLVEGIDEVAVGDLTRVILRERDDEIGDLAERFNQMTTSLREARAETQRGVEAKLALEARLRHSEKLATIGQLAAGIAHEVGTPLNVIGGRARAMQKKAGLGEAPEVEKNAGIIAAQATRITKIIQQLLDYARKKAVVRAPVDLAAVVRATVEFLEHKIASSRVEVVVTPFARAVDDEADAGAVAAAGGEGPRAPVVVGDGDQLQQVCLNLCVNALEAMPAGGRLEIGTRATLRRKPGLDMAAPSRYVVLEVSDTGTGIPPADRERIFEPFYSTKQDGGGTGLGLAVSQGIVKDHDGWIEIEGGATGGTRFRVFLPAQEPAPDESALHGSS